MAFFLFPDVMYERFSLAVDIMDSYHSSFIIPDELRYAYELHQILTKQYLGLGALLQFIPGTNQKRAREHLSKLLVENIKSVLDKKNPQSIDRATLSSISSYLNLAPLWRLVKDIKRGFGLDMTAGNDPDEFMIKLIINLPLLSDIIDESYDSRKFFQLKRNALFSVMHSLINPARLIYSGLNTAHLIAMRLIELFRDILIAFRIYGYPFELLVKTTTKISDVVFGILKTPVKILEGSIDLLFDGIKTLFINPIKHVFKSMRFAAEGKELLVANVKELQDLKELRRFIKHNKLLGYETRTGGEYRSKNREYIGISKSDLYNQFTNKTRMVVVKAPKRKLAQSKELLDLIRFFKKTNPNKQSITELDDVTRDEAKTILNIK